MSDDMITLVLVRFPYFENVSSLKIKYACVMSTYKFNVTQIPLTNSELSMLRENPIETNLQSVS
jgi:hypothetical protein